MSDEDLVIKVAQPTVEPKIARNWVGWIAIVISLIALIFSVLQWLTGRETNTIARAAQSPYLEIQKAEFVSQTSLLLHVRNIGHHPALKPTGQNDVYLGTWFGPGATFNKANIFAPAIAIMPTIPVGAEGLVGPYMPQESILSQYNSYQRDMVIELRGSITYSDDEDAVHKLDYCYVVHSPWGPGLPTVGECIRDTDVKFSR